MRIPGIPVTLPSGLWLEGVHCREVMLRPLVGEDEAFLLELDHEAPPAVRATALLGRCVALAGVASASEVSEGTALARRLTAGDREALLLHLRRATLGERIESVIPCPACGAAVELAPTVGELLLAPYEDPQPEYARSLLLDGGPVDVVLRLPTGGDQEDAAVLVAADAGDGGAEAAALLVARCTLEARHAGATLAVDALPTDAAAAIADELGRLDPQAELLLAADCPACGERLEALLDAASFLLSELAARARALYQEVHTLALHYHWSERDILGMGGRRRRRYLELLTAS